MPLQTPPGARSRLNEGMESSPEDMNPAERGRWRTISIRLTDEEYQAVSTVHSKAGFRSMSDFGRTAILDRARTLSGQRSLLSASLLTLGSRLSELDSHLKDLRTEIGVLLGGDQRRQQEEEAAVAEREREPQPTE